MNLISRIWTDSVAYVMLLAGAGLSILFNVVDTLNVRGAATDWIDWVIAIAAPALVVGMVEMFVSARWIGQPWFMQALRWAGTVGIGGEAMRASWTHGHALLLARGQTADVAAGWPLSIDTLAIMATALILSGRIRTLVMDKPVDTDSRTQTVEPDTDNAWTGPTASVQDVAEFVATFREDNSQDTADLSDYQAKMRATVPDSIPDWMDPPVVPGSTSPRRASKVHETDLVQSIKFQHAAGLRKAEIDRAVALALGCSAKTVYRARLALDLS